MLKLKGSDHFLISGITVVAYLLTQIFANVFPNVFANIFATSSEFFDGLVFALLLVFSYSHFFETLDLCRERQMLAAVDQRGIFWSIGLILAIGLVFVISDNGAIRQSAVVSVERLRLCAPTGAFLMWVGLSGDLNFFKLVPVLHGLQYFVFTQRLKTEMGVSRRRRLVSFTLIVALGFIGFVLLPKLATNDETLKYLALYFIIGANLLHFYLDGLIWKRHVLQKALAATKLPS